MTDLDAELKRAEARVADLETELRGIIESADGANLDDEHDAEGATVGFERARVTALLEAARARVLELHDAVRRAGAGSYGTCESCGLPIGAERLDALPTTRTCVNCATR